MSNSPAIGERQVGLSIDYRKARACDPGWAWPGGGRLGPHARPPVGWQVLLSPSMIILTSLGDPLVSEIRGEGKVPRPGVLAPLLSV